MSALPKQIMEQKNESKIMRASKLPLAAKCRRSASQRTFGSSIASLGTAFHELAKAKVLSQRVDVESIKVRYGLTREDLDSLFAAINNIEINVPQGAIVIADDVKLKSTTMNTSGHPDFVIIKGNHATVIDWKSGWADVEDPEINLQVIDYAVMVMEKYPEIEIFDLMLVMPKQNTIKAVRLSKADIQARALDIKQIIEEAETDDAEYTVGAHCSGCYGCMSCPAFAGEVEKFAALSHPGNIEKIDNIEKSLSYLLPYAKIFGIVAKKIEAVAKAYVDKNGSLDLGVGQYVKSIETREKIDPSIAMPLLESFFDDPIFDLISISKSAIKKKATAKGRGENKKIYDQLKEAGAIKETPTVFYRVMKGINNGSEKTGITENRSSANDGADAKA